MEASVLSHDHITSPSDPHLSTWQLRVKPTISPADPLWHMISTWVHFDTAVSSLKNESVYWGFAVPHWSSFKYIVEAYSLTTCISVKLVQYWESRCSLSLLHHVEKETLTNNPRDIIMIVICVTAWPPWRFSLICLNISIYTRPALAYISTRGH